MSDCNEQPQISEENEYTIGSGYGFLLCIFTEMIYVLSNILLRWMTEFQDISPDWTIMIKEVVAVIFCLPVIAFLAIRGRYRFPSWKTFMLLIPGAICCEFFGARFHLWSYAIIGIVLAMPLIQIFSLLGVASLGCVTLGEKISRLKLLAMTILIASIVILAISQSSLSSGSAPLQTVGAPEVSSASQDASDCSFSLDALLGQIGPDWRFPFGLAVALVTGLGYACYILLLRQAMKSTIVVDGREVKEVPISLSMVMVCGTGVLVGAFFLFIERGADAFWNVPQECWWITLTAGVANLIGFYFRNLSFRYVTASKQAFVSTFQIMSLAILGVVFFGEPTNLLLWIGISLTGLGIILAGFTR